MVWGENRGKITKSKFISIRGYYRHVYILTYKNNKEVKIRVRKWVKPYSRKKTKKKRMFKKIKWKK